MPEIDQVSAASTWTQTSDTDFKDGTFDNIRAKGTGESAELKIEISGLDHWIDKTPEPRPTSYPGTRYTHAMATIATTDEVLMYGGYTNSGQDTVTWVYDLSDDAWVDKKPSNNPGTRTYQVMASVSNDDKVVLFGGKTNAMGNDTWLYDLSDNAWVEKTPQNPNSTNNPPLRMFSSMASISGTDKVALFGGFISGPTYFNDLWVYDVSDDNWIEMPTPGKKPSPRHTPAMAAIEGTDKIVLFGGNQSLNDVWVYDLSDDAWTEMAKGPSSRTSSRMTTVFGTDNVILFGGSYLTTPNTVYYNDTWIFDYNKGSQGTWTEITGDIAPSGRDRFAMAGFVGTDKILLYGGATCTSPWQSDETWMYKHDLSMRNGTYTSIAYNTYWNSTFKSISWIANTPLGTSITFQLRTGWNESCLYTKPFLGPDGTSAIYYTKKSGEPIWSGHTGDRWIQYKAFFNITSGTTAPSLKEVTISYNCLPQIAVISPINGSLLTVNKPVFKWEFEDNDSISQKAFQVLIDDEIDFEDVSYDSGELNIEEEYWEFPTGTTYTKIQDGTWYWKVRIQDADDTWTDYSTPWEIMIDTTAPISAPESPVNNGFYKSLDMITGTAYEASIGSGINTVEINIKRVSDNFYWNGKTWRQLTTWLPAIGTSEWTYDSSDIAWKSNTKYYVQSRTTDIAGNIEVPTDGNMFTIDMESPMSTIEHPGNDFWLNNIDEVFGKSFDQGGAGVASVEICINCTTYNTYWDGAEWSFEECWLITEGLEDWTYDTSEVSFYTGNEYCILSRATDNVNIMEVPSTGKVFKYDARAPESSILINNDEKYTCSTMVTLFLESYDSGSGVSEIALNGDGIVWTDWRAFNNTITYELPPNDGKKFVYLKVKDEAGNIGGSVYDSIILDSTPPEKLSIIIQDDITYTNSSNVLLALQASDSLSGIANMSFSTNGKDWTAWETFSTTKSFVLSPPDGEKTIHFRASDKAGNIAEQLDTIIMDTEPPHSLSLEINDGAIKTDSTTVILRVNALDNASGVYMMSFSTDGKNWSTWETFTYERSFILPPKDGSKTVYFKVKDNLGNIAEPVSTTILVDNTSGNGQKKDQSSTLSIVDMIIWFILIFIIIIIAVVVSIFVVKKRKKHLSQELLRANALTIKPGGRHTPVISIGQISETAKLPQLQGSTQLGNLKYNAKSGPTGTITSVPTLASSTQEPTKPTPTLTPMLLKQRLPQLPPAKSNETKSKTEPVAQSPVPTLITSGQTSTQNVKVSASPTHQQEPQKPTLAVNKPTAVAETGAQAQTQPSNKMPSPTVHLPDSPQPTIISTPTISQQKPTEKNNYIN